jgi:lysophospholipase L1-like esterase
VVGWLAALLCILSLFCIPSTLAGARMAVPIIGPKEHYLALGDSMAFGYQPNLDFDHGYAEYFYQNLRQYGTSSYVNMSCPGETSKTIQTGECPYPFLRKYPYLGSQLEAALTYINEHKGKVSPVTFNIGSNDILSFFDVKTCKGDVPRFRQALQQMDMQLTQVIFPKLREALTVNGEPTGDIILVNYYNPFQNECPNTVQFIQELNGHLAADIRGYGSLVDTFAAFGGAETPNLRICAYTWICSDFHDIHATPEGHQVIARAISRTVGY